MPIESNQIPNLSGHWTGEMTGTNNGLITADVVQEGVTLKGVAHLSEQSVGPYEHSLSGLVARGQQGRPRVTLNLTPVKSAGASIGPVRAEGVVISQGEMQGTWSSIQGRWGQFSLRSGGVLRPKAMSSPGRPASGLPPGSGANWISDMQALPENFRQALLMRCVLRALPRLARMGNFDFWPNRAQTRRHLECIMRAVQAGLINCTANSARSQATVGACRIAYTTAQYALSAMSTDQEGVREVVGLAGQSAEAPKTIFALGVLGELLAIHFGDYPEAQQAARDDLTVLAMEAQSNSTWASPDFFRRRLWPGPSDPKQWTADRAALISAFEAVGMAEFSASYLHWAAQGLQPPEVADAITSLEHWAERHQRGQEDKLVDTDVEIVDDASPPKPPPKSPDSRHVESLFCNDVRADSDRLNRQRLAKILGVFLADERTRTPLTLSIEGAWGSGKTTFMHLMEKELKAAATKARPITCIWFNPWRFQSHDELWAGFALTGMAAAQSGLGWYAKIHLWCRLHWKLFDLRKGGIDLFVFLISCLVWLVLFGMALALLRSGVFGLADKKWLSATAYSTFGLLGVLMTVKVAKQQVTAFFGNPFDIDLGKHVDKPDYYAKASFLAKFQEHFRVFCDVYFPAKSRIVVFVDDLDRCDVPQAANLMQGINLMLSDDSPFIYVLGMDRAKVAAGIAVKHKDLLQFLHTDRGARGTNENLDIRFQGLAHGYEFMEKFIQLSFRLPPNDTEELRGFIRSRLIVQEQEKPASRSSASTGDSIASSSSANVSHVSAATPQISASDQPAPVVLRDESHLEAPILHAALVLGDNPRRIGQLINLVRLQRLLAPELGLKLTVGQLAKWTAIALRWPILILDLTDDPALLVRLLSARESDTETPRERWWRTQHEFMSFLYSEGPAGGNAADYNLTDPGVIESLLRLGVSVALNGR